MENEEKRESAIRKAYSFKGMADAAVKAGNMSQAEKFIEMFGEGMKNVYEEYPSERTKKGWFSGIAAVSLFYQSHRNPKKAFPFAKQSFELIMDLYEINPRSAEYAMAAVQQGDMLISCCGEIGELDMGLDTFDKIEPIAESLESAFGQSNEIINKIMATHNYVRSMLN